MRSVEMTNSIDKTIKEIMSQSMSNAFTVKEDDVVGELTEDQQRKIDVANAIEEAKVARKLAEEEEARALEEVKMHKSEKATTSDEKNNEIVEKSVKNKIEINPEMKESIVGKIYQMYNNKYLSEKQYTLTNADKAGNTKAWQDRDKKNVKTGEKIYKKADHMNEEDEVSEAKVDQGKTAEKKSSDRNKRNTPPGADSKFDTKVFITRKDGESLDSARTRKRREAHADKRGVKEEKKTLTIEENDKLYLMKANGDVAYEVTDLLLPDPITELNRYSKETGKSLKTGRSVKKGGSDDKALNFVRSKIRKETGKPEGQRKKVRGAKSNEKNTSLERKIDKLKSKRAYADRAKKAGFKSTQDYTNTVARYGGEDNYKKGRGLGT